MKTKVLRKSLVIAGLLALLCGYVPPVAAISLSYSQATGFLVGSTNLVSDDPTTPYNDIKWYQLGSLPAPPAGEYDTIAWGVSNNGGGLLGTDPFGNANYSGLRVIGFAGSVSTGTNGEWGEPVIISRDIHQNSSISSSYFTLLEATVLSQLTIGSYVDNNPIALTFSETLNSLPHVGPTSPPAFMTLNPDYWQFSANGFAPLSFTEGGHYYEVQFDIANFSNSVLMVSNDVFTIWTAEGTTSSVDVMMQIREVPEPATLLTLLGAGALLTLRHRIRRAIGRAYQP